MTRRVAVVLLMATAAGCATLARSTGSLSLEEKIGQLFVYAAKGVFLNEASPEYRDLLRQVRENRIGGIAWFAADVYETALLTKRLQAIARVPLLIAADLESGIGMRFEDTTDWPWAMAVGATGDPSLAERQGRIVAREARAIGLNQIYAPVADVNSDPDNPVINVRSYGEDPEAVGRFVAAFVRGVQSEEVLATVKHFPGHGDTHADSHRSLPILSATRARLDEVELVPFRAALAAGVGAVMTAHLSLPSIEPDPAPARSTSPPDNPYSGADSEVTERATMPASLSARVVDGLLRRDLGFDGLVVADALDMGGITDHFDPGEAAVRAILAGNDQVIKSPETDAALAGVRRAVASGRISMARLNASVERILAAKARVGAPEPDLDRIFRFVDHPEHRALAEEIARRSLTLVREEAGALPLARSTRLLHLVVSDSAGTPAEILEQELTRRLDRSPETLRIHPSCSGEEVAAALAAAARSDAVLLSLFVRFRTGAGTIATPPAGLQAIEALLAAGVRVVAVSFGSPYVIREIPALPTYLAAYGSQTVTQAAVARALFGEAAIEGKLPVTIPGIAPRGSGIARAAR